MLIKKFVADNAQLSKDESTWQEFEDGRLIVPVTLTRTGIFKYRYEDIFKKENPDYPKKMFPGGVIRVLRDFDDVTSEKSLNSMRGMYFTDEHPTVDVTSENWKELSKGQFSTELVVREENYGDFSLHFVDSLLTIIDSSAKKLLRSGKKQISLGYSANFYFNFGIWHDGQPYDARQLDIENNHGALVYFGRAGDKVTIGDSETVYQIEDSENIIENEEKKTFMIIKGRTVVLDTAGEILVQQELDERDNKIKTLEIKANLADSLEAKVLNLETALQDAKNVDVEAIAEERLAVISKAKNYVKDSDFRGKSIPEIQKMAVSEYYKGKDLSNKSEIFFHDSWDLLSDTPPTSQTQKTGIRDSFINPSTKSKVSDNDTISAVASRLANAYKPKK